MKEDWNKKIRLLKYNDKTLKEIIYNPNKRNSKEYLIDIRKGKLPFTVNQDDGSYECPFEPHHINDLNNAVYITEEEACGLNITIKEFLKAKTLTEEILEKQSKK